MGNKICFELTLCFLLMAGFCLEAVIETKIIVYDAAMNWTEARVLCQERHVDMISWYTLNRHSEIKEYMKRTPVWIGLVRDPEDATVWNWINYNEGISEDNVSQNISWAEKQKDPHCAAVWKNNRKFFSDRCSAEKYFYCSTKGRIQHHQILLDWYGASQYCQNNRGELATITQNNTGKLNMTGWIGLYQKTRDTWSWIGDAPNGYRNWGPAEPWLSNCASFDAATESYFSFSCANTFIPVCYDDGLVVVNENKTWEEALSHCLEMTRPCVNYLMHCEHKYNLVSLDEPSDYIYVRDRIYRATTDEVWTGLRFLGGSWWWVNGHELEDQGQLPRCPPEGKHCGTLSKYDTNNWIIRDCSERRNFICY